MTSTRPNALLGSRGRQFPPVIRWGRGAPASGCRPPGRLRSRTLTLCSACALFSAPTLVAPFLVAASTQATRGATTLDLAPMTAHPGQEVAMTGDGYGYGLSATETPGQTQDNCLVRWNGKAFPEAKCGFDGEKLSGRLVVPKDATPSEVTIRVCRVECSEEAFPSGTRTLTILEDPVSVPVAGAPPVEGPRTRTVLENPISVPGVVNLSLDEARRALEAAGLTAGTVSGNGSVVASQDPHEKTRVARGTHVDLTLRAPRSGPPSSGVMPGPTGMTPNKKGRTFRPLAHQKPVMADEAVRTLEPSPPRKPARASAIFLVFLAPLLGAAGWVARRRLRARAVSRFGIRPVHDDLPLMTLHLEETRESVPRLSVIGVPDSLSASMSQETP